MKNSELKALLKSVHNSLKKRPEVCEYWDVRIEKVQKTGISYQNYECISCSIKPSLGAFIRVFNNGMWFFSSTTDLSSIESTIERLSKQTKEMAIDDSKIKVRPFNDKARSESFLVNEKVRLDAVSIDTKREVVESYFKTLQSFKSLINVQVHYSDEYKVKFFQSSTDIDFEVDFNQCGIFARYSIVEGENRFDDKLNFHGGDISKLKNRNEEMKSEIELGHQFLTAKAVKPGSYPVVLDADMTGLFAHESFGHKSEADFMLGDEEAVKTWSLGKKIGNDCLSIVDWGAEEGTSGYCPIDDEGFPTQKTYLIKNGVLNSRLHSQYTAEVLGEEPTGNARAMSFEYEPIVRMTNTYVEAGNKSFDEMIKDIELGVYATAAAHGSGLSTFTMAPRRSWMIRNGKLAEPVRVSVISGDVVETLNNIEGCSDNFKLHSSAFGGCGKNDQWPLPVGTGGANILVSKLVVS